jgi:hypoxanthine phosphoribosyltransferase
MIDFVFQYLGIFSSIFGLGFTIREIARKRAGKLSWTQIERGIADLTNIITNKNFDPDMIIGVGKGGSIIAGMLSTKLGYKPVFHVDRQVNFRQNDGQPEGVKIISSEIPITNKKVLLVNGESYSGWTIGEVKKILLEKNPQTIMTAAIIALSSDNLIKERVIYSPDIYSILVKRRQMPPWKR